MSLGVPVKYHHHEVGTCQVEIELDFCDALKAADYTMLIKYVARNVGKKDGLRGQFYAKTTVRRSWKWYARAPVPCQK